MSAPVPVESAESIEPGGQSAQAPDPLETRSAPVIEPEVMDALRDGELELIGRLIGSSNNAMVVRVWPPTGGERVAPREPGRPIEDGDLLAVYKPTAGERPLFDFPIGTLTRREVATYLVSEALGWSIVPPTLLRDGPFGEGSVQLWIDVDPEADPIAMVNDDDPRLRRVAVLDAIVNNTDRKAGHLLPVAGGHLYAVDHGVTFSEEPKLRTVLWAWEGEPFADEEVAGLARVRSLLGGASAGGALPAAASLPGDAPPVAPGPLAVALRELLAAPEVDATRARIDALLAAGVFPGPSPDWPAIPWPPV